MIGALPGKSSLATQLGLMPLAVLGGLGLPVLLHLVDRVFRRAPASTHVRAVLTWTAVVYTAGVVLLLAVDGPPLHGTGSQWRRALIDASTLSLNARSAGFPFSFATEWSRGVQWVAMLLMLIGGASGGTAGGVKVNTVGVLVGAAADPCSLRTSPLAVAVRWVMIYGTGLGISLLAVLTTEPQIPGDRVLFLVVSAFSNVGLSHDPVVLSDSGWWVMAAVMLIGRLTPILTLWWMADTMREPTIAIG